MRFLSRYHGSASWNPGVLFLEFTRGSITGHTVMRHIQGDGYATMRATRSKEALDGAFEPSNAAICIKFDTSHQLEIQRHHGRCHLNNLSRNLRLLAGFQIW